MYDDKCHNWCSKNMDLFMSVRLVVRLVVRTLAVRSCWRHCDCQVGGLLVMQVDLMEVVDLCGSHQITNNAK